MAVCNKLPHNHLTIASLATGGETSLRRVWQWKLNVGVAPRMFYIARFDKVSGAVVCEYNNVNLLEDFREFRFGFLSVHKLGSGLFLYVYVLRSLISRLGQVS